MRRRFGLGRRTAVALEWRRVYGPLVFGGKTAKTSALRRGYAGWRGQNPCGTRTLAYGKIWQNPPRHPERGVRDLSRPCATFREASPHDRRAAIVLPLRLSSPPVPRTPPTSGSTAHETYLPTQRAPSQEEARFPVPHADAGRSRHRQAPPCQGPQPTLCLAAAPSSRCARALASKRSTARAGAGELVESWSSAGRVRPISPRSGSLPAGGWGTRCSGTAPSADSVKLRLGCRCGRARPTCWSPEPRWWT